MNLVYAVVIVTMLLGFYCIVVKRNLIKIVLGLTILGDGVNLFLISLGYKAEGIPPIITSSFIEDINSFAAMAVDPLPQALVLTAIVINMSVTAFALALAVMIYRKYGTLDTKRIRRLRE